MGKLRAHDPKNKTIKLNRSKEKSKKKWEQIVTSVSRIDRSTYDSRRLEVMAWKYNKQFIDTFYDIYSKLGYVRYAFTITRGNKDANMNDLKRALTKAINDMNREIYRDRIKGLTLPILVFEGNSKALKYNPHLHGYVLLKRGYVLKFRKKIRQELKIVFSHLPSLLKRKLEKSERNQKSFWIKKYKGDLKDYIGYCGRLEDPTKEKELDKIDWDLSSFGFISKPEHKDSKRIENRIYREFPESKESQFLFHKAIAMLHWIQNQEFSMDLLREFIPPMTTNGLESQANASNETDLTLTLNSFIKPKQRQKRRTENQSRPIIGRGLQMGFS